ncbi:MAG: AraC family transcriptional regulator [Bacteroidota bacterium]
MKVFKFHSSKYGRELLLDIGKYKDTPVYFFKDEPHTVDFYELFFFRKAKGRFLLDDRVIELQDRQIIFASPFQLRSWQVDRADLEGYFMIFANQFLELFFTDPLFVFRLQFFYNNTLPLELTFGETIFFNFECTCESMLAELEDLRPDSEDFLRAHLLLTLAGLNRRYCTKYGLLVEKLTPEEKRKQDFEVLHFKQLVERHIRSHQKVEEYAQLLGISRVNLNQKVKRYFGVTAKDFIKRRVLTEIKKELLFSKKTISEIAYVLQFAEASSLIRFFTKLEGRSPSAYRKIYQKVNPLIKE